MDIDRVTGILEREYRPDRVKLEEELDPLWPLNDFISKSSWHTEEERIKEKERTEHLLSEIIYPFIFLRCDDLAKHGESYGNERTGFSFETDHQSGVRRLSITRGSEVFSLEVPPSTADCPEPEVQFRWETRVNGAQRSQMELVITPSSGIPFEAKPSEENWGSGRDQNIAKRIIEILSQESITIPSAYGSNETDKKENINDTIKEIMKLFDRRYINGLDGTWLNIWGGSESGRAITIIEKILLRRVYNPRNNEVENDNVKLLYGSGSIEINSLRCYEIVEITHEDNGLVTKYLLRGTEPVGEKFDYKKVQELLDRVFEAMSRLPY